MCILAVVVGVVGSEENPSLLVSPGAGYLDSLLEIFYLEKVPLFLAKIIPNRQKAVWKLIAWGTCRFFDLNKL